MIIWLFRILIFSFISSFILAVSCIYLYIFTEWKWLIDKVSVLFAASFLTIILIALLGFVNGGIIV